MHDVLIKLRSDAAIGTTDRRLFGAFVEHLGRCVYGGIYEPDHPSADQRGFRGDVLALVRELGPTIGTISRRQFRFRLQLGGRRRSTGGTATAPRPCLAIDRDQPVRYQ